MQGGKKGFLTTVESREHACATGHFWWGEGPGNAEAGLQGGLGQGTWQCKGGASGWFGPMGQKGEAKQDPGLVDMKGEGCWFPVPAKRAE